MMRNSLPLAVGFALMSGVAGAQDSAAPVMDDKKLDDKKVVMAVMSSNDAEIRMADMALRKTQRAEVRDYATMLRRDHSALNDKLREVATRMAIPVKDSTGMPMRDSAWKPMRNDSTGRPPMRDSLQGPPMRDSLGQPMKHDNQGMDHGAKKDSTHHKYADLAAMSGPQFDRAYLNQMVEKHRKMLTTIDTELLPAVADAGLRSILEGAKPTVQEHLRQAEALVTAVSADTETTTQQAAPPSPPTVTRSPRR